MARTSRFPELGIADRRCGRAGSDLVQAVVQLLPQSLIDDLQLRELLHDSLVTRIGPRQPFASLRILDVTLLVPDQAPDIELVAQNARASGCVAAQGCIQPGSAVGT